MLWRAVWMRVCTVAGLPYWGPIIIVLYDGNQDVGGDESSDGDGGVGDGGDSDSDGDDRGEVDDNNRS